MDKNMIKIDDLVHSRLGGAEEREPAGAWGAMKDLLDKEMPVQSAASFNWRRMLGYATGLVMATSVAVGGYRAIYAEKSEGISAVRVANTAIVNGKAVKTAATDSHSTSAVTPVADHASGQEAIFVKRQTPGHSTGKHTTAKQSVGNKTTIADHTAGNHDTKAAAGVAARNTKAKALVNTGDEQTVANKAQAGTQPGIKAHGSLPSLASEHKITTKAVATATNGAARDQVATNTAKPKEAVANKGVNVNPVSGAMSSNAGANRTLALKGSNNSGNATNAGNIPHSGDNRSQGPTETIIPSSAVNTSANRSIALNDQPGVKRPDSIQQIEIKHRMVYNPETEKMIYRADTLVFRKVGIERETPVLLAANETTKQSGTGKKQAFKPSAEKTGTREPAVAIAKNEPAVATVLPQATMMTAEAVDNNNLVSLSKFRVSSKFNKLWDANAQRFNAFVQNVNIAIAKAQLYGGITGGFNTTVFSANTLAGFQLGLTGILAFNERWSIAADLKYNHRFNTASINDNYSKVSNIIPGAESQVNGMPFREYTWDEEGIIHYYNLTAVQNFELPVTLRYNIGRIFGEVGLNMFYSLPVNVEEVERSQGNMMTVTRNFPANTSPGESIGGGKHVMLQDFNARFGMGYVIGAGYEFTPALNANIRLVQNVWDNAVGSGTAKVSRNLYQTPSIQFSIGYRFSQGAGRR